MTGWIIWQNTDFCATQWEERLYNAIVGVIYCFWNRFYETPFRPNLFWTHFYPLFFIFFVAKPSRMILGKYGQTNFILHL
jgi:hypothetical protein